MTPQSRKRTQDLTFQMLLRSQYGDFMDVATIGTLLVVHGISSAPAEIRQAMFEGLTDFIREQIPREELSNNGILR